MLRASNVGASESVAQQIAILIPAMNKKGYDFAKSMGLDRACLAKSAAQGGRSHDNYFHSILGMMNVSADLSRAEDLEKVEARLRDDQQITGLVNNAGIAGEGAITALDPAYVTTMINLNILAVTRLAAAIAPRLRWRRRQRRAYRLTAI